MKHFYPILFAMCVAPGVMAESVTVDFADIETTQSYAPITVQLDEAIAIECANARINGNLFLTPGTYMSVVSDPSFAISEIKVNFRPAGLQDGVLTSDYNAYKFDTETNLAKPDYDSFIIAPNGTISNPNYDSMIWNADGNSLSRVSFRCMRDNNSALSIESVEITYGTVDTPAPEGLPFVASEIEVDATEWYFGPTVSIENFDDKAYALCQTNGSGSYEVVLIPGKDHEAVDQAIVLASYPDESYNAIAVESGEYTVAVKAVGNAEVASLSVSAVPASWPAGRPAVTDVRLSDKIWHNVEVEISFPTNAWNGEPLAEASVNTAQLLVNGKSGRNIIPDFTVGTATYAWTAPTGPWTFGGEWKYAYNANAIPFEGAEGEMTVAPLDSDPEDGIIFECIVDGADYYNQFSTINNEKKLKGNLAGEEFPFCSARPASQEYRYGWYVIFSNTKALRLNQQIDCWLLLPVLSLEVGKTYGLEFENEGITADKDPVVAFLPISEELSFDNMSAASTAIPEEISEEGVFTATYAPQESGSYYIGLRLCNNDGDNPNGVSANIFKISVAERGSSSIAGLHIDNTTDTYLDLMGRKVNNPASGSIVIKIANGKAQKVIVR